MKGGGSRNADANGCVLVERKEIEVRDTFFLSRMEPRPRTIILQPVSCSNCLAVIPRGPRIRPTKLNCKRKVAHISFTGTVRLSLKVKIEGGQESHRRHDVNHLFLRCGAALTRCEIYGRGGENPHTTKFVTFNLFIFEPATCLKSQRMKFNPI